MQSEIRVPPLGESVVEAVVGKWLKNIGDPIALGDPVVELETDKVNLEVPAEQAGTLEHIARESGATVAVGDVLGTLTQVASGATAQAGAPMPAVEASATATASVGAVEGNGDRAQATPVARRIASESQIDLAHVAGSGPGGRITKQDVMAFQGSAPAPAGVPAPLLLQPWSLFPRRRSHRPRQLPHSVMGSPTGAGNSESACHAAGRLSHAGWWRRSIPPQCLPPSMKWICRRLWMCASGGGTPLRSAPV